MEDDVIPRPLHELIGEALRSIDTVDETGWGPWKLERSTRVVYVDSPYHYEIEIVRLTPHLLSGVLKHMFSKPWVNNEYLGGLVRAAFALSEAGGDSIHTT